MAKEEKIIKLMEFIKKNNLSDLKNYIRENSIIPEDFHNFNEILIESIKNNISLEIIEFLIKERHEKDLNYYIYSSDDINSKKIIKVPIFIAIMYKNFKVSNLLLKNNANINYVANNYNIIEYLMEYEQPNITIKSLKYILRNGFNRNYIKKDLLINLIKKNQNIALKMIIDFYKRLDTNTILNTFLIDMYKNRIPCSKKELNNLFTQLHRIDVDDTMYEHANYYGNKDAIKILFENDESEANRLFIRIIKYQILDNAIQSENRNYIEKVLSYKTFWYQYQGFKRKKLRLSEILDTYIPKVMNKSFNIIKLVIKTFLIESITKSNQNSNRNYDIHYVIYLLNMFIRCNRMDLVYYLMDSEDFKLMRDDINIKDIKGEYPIVTVVISKNFELFKYLLKIGADINTKNKENSSLLLLSIHHYPDLAKYLLTLPNLNINEMNKKGFYPLLEAIHNNYIELAKSIIDYAYKYNIILEINKADDSEKNYPLLEVIRHNNIPLFQTLLLYSSKYHLILNINDKNVLNSYPLLAAISHNNTTIVKLLIDYACEHHIELILNEIDYRDSYPLIEAIQQNNIEIIQLLLEYSNQHNVVINLNNHRDNDYNTKNSPFLEAFQQNDISILNLLIEYADKHNIKIDINRKGKDGNFPLLVAVKENSIMKVKFLMHYAKRHHIILDINRKNKSNISPLTEAIVNRKKDILQLLMEYSNENNLILNMVDKGFYGTSPFFASILSKDYSITELIMEYSQKHNIVLNINEKDDSHYYPLIVAIDRNDLKMAKLLINYATANRITLDINNKDRELGEMCPFHIAISHGHMEMAKLLIDYGEKNNVIIDLNGKDQRGNFLFLEAVNQDNLEAIQLLMEYAERNNIPININEKDLFENYPLFMAIYRGNEAVVKLIMDYCERHKILLNMNQTDEFGSYPLDYCISDDSTEISKLLVNYAKKHHIILKRSHHKRRKYV